LPAATTCRFSPAHNEPKTSSSCRRSPCPRPRSSSPYPGAKRSKHRPPWRSTSCRGRRHCRNCHLSRRRRRARPRSRNRPCHYHYNSNHLSPLTSSLPSRNRRPHPSTPSTPRRTGGANPQDTRPELRSELCLNSTRCSLPSPNYTTDHISSNYHYYYYNTRPSYYSERHNSNSPPSIPVYQSQPFCMSYRRGCPQTYLLSL